MRHLRRDGTERRTRIGDFGRVSKNLEVEEEQADAIVRVEMSIVKDGRWEDRGRRRRRDAIV